MPQPDVSIGQYATGPVLEEIMTDPQGNPIPLAGATVRFIMAPRNRAVPAIEGHVEIQTPDTDGRVQQIWQAGDTDVSGLWDYQWIVTLPGGEIVQIPTNPKRRYRTLEIIKRLEQPSALAASSGPWLTIDTIAILRIMDVSTYVAGAAFAVVREANKRYRFDATSGLPDDGAAVVASSNGGYQWLQF